MYIHNYQIHNVLNFFRKQLSQKKFFKQPPPQATPTDRMEISKNSQRQSLIDQVSADIVERLVKTGPQKNFNLSVNPPKDKTAEQQAKKREAEFTYTAIDENDRKIFTTLPIEKLSPLIDR